MSTANTLTPAPVRAATRIRSAVWPSRTYSFSPVSVQLSPEPLASRVTPASSQRPDASARATVAMVDPLAIPGRYSFLAASSPDTSSRLAARATLEKYGAHSRARPISSSTTISST